MVQFCDVDFDDVICIWRRVKNDVILVVGVNCFFEKFKIAVLGRKK